MRAYKAKEKAYYVSRVGRTRSRDSALANHPRDFFRAIYRGKRARLIARDPAAGAFSRGTFPPLDRLG